MPGKVLDIRSHFLKKFNISSNGCWEWKPKKHHSGYGYFWMNSGHVLAHRAAYILFVGEIPKGMFVLHSCDNRICVNPAHLSVGDLKENARQMVERNRQAKGERNNAQCGAGTVLAIREDFKRDSSYGVYTKLSKKYGVKYDAIRAIIRRKTWKHI